MFCVKCRKSTSNKNEKKSVSSNGRNMLKAECADCGTKKSQFVSGASKPVKNPKKQLGGMYGQNQKTELPEMEFIEEKPKKMKAKKNTL